MSKKSALNKVLVPVIAASAVLGGCGKAARQPADWIDNTADRIEAEMAGGRMPDMFEMDAAMDQMGTFDVNVGGEMSNDGDTKDKNGDYIVSNRYLLLAVEYGADGGELDVWGTKFKLGADEEGTGNFRVTEMTYSKGGAEMFSIKDEDGDGAPDSTERVADLIELLRARGDPIEGKKYEEEIADEAITAGYIPQELTMYSALDEKGFEVSYEFSKTSPGLMEYKMVGERTVDGKIIRVTSEMTTDIHASEGWMKRESNSTPGWGIQRLTVQLIDKATGAVLEEGYMEDWMDMNHVRGVDESGNADLITREFVEKDYEP